MSAVTAGTKVKIIVSGNNKWIWPHAYRDEKEAEFMCGWLDEKFVLNSPFYTLDLEIE